MKLCSHHILVAVTEIDHQHLLGAHLSALHGAFGQRRHPPNYWLDQTRGLCCLVRHLSQQLKLRLYNRKIQASPLGKSPEELRGAADPWRKCMLPQASLRALLSKPLTQQIPSLPLHPVGSWFPLPSSHFPSLPTGSKESWRVTRWKRIVEQTSNPSTILLDPR